MQGAGRFDYWHWDRAPIETNYITPKKNIHDERIGETKELIEKK